MYFFIIYKRRIFAATSVFKFNGYTDPKMKFLQNFYIIKSDSVNIWYPKKSIKNNQETTIIVESVTVDGCAIS